MFEGDEQFNAQISTVSGGATIGNPSSTITIIEDSSEYSVPMLCACVVRECVIGKRNSF